MLSINVSTVGASDPVTGEEFEGTTLVSGYGPLRAISYLAKVGVEELEGLEAGDAEARVTIEDGSTRVLSFTGDADSAASLLKSKVAKLRKAAKDAGDADA